MKQSAELTYILGICSIKEQDVSWPGKRKLAALLGLRGLNINEAEVNVKLAGANDSDAVISDTQPLCVVMLFKSVVDLLSLTSGSCTAASLYQINCAIK